MNLHLTNSLDTTQTWTLDVPETALLGDLLKALNAAPGAHPRFTRATVGKGYTDATSKARKTVWVWPEVAKPVPAPKPTPETKPAKAKAKTTKPSRITDLSTRERDALTRAANVAGITRAEAAKRLGLVAR